MSSEDINRFVERAVVSLEEPLQRAAPGANALEYSTAGAPTLKRFLMSRAPIQALMGPFGSGKSVADVVKLMMLAHEVPPGADGTRRSRWLIARNTYGQLRDTTMKTFFEWVPPGRFGEYRASENVYVVDRFKGVHAEFLFRALDRPQHVANLLSLELTGAWLNEAREMPGAILGPLRGRFGRYPRIADVGEYPTYLLMDTNPPDTDSWFYDLFEKRRPEGAELFRQPSGRSEAAENRRYLPADYYERMVEVMSEDEVRVYVDGEYGYLRTGRPVYPEYKDSFHCKPFEARPLPILRCWDFGLTPACVFLQLQPNGQVRAIDEVASDRAGIQQFAPVVLGHMAQHYPWARERGVRDVGDPAGEFGSQTDEQSCMAILRAAGVDCWPGVQDVAVRLESVRHLLRTVIDGEPGLLIHPRCERLRKGFQGEYHYRKLAVGGAVEKYADVPEKNKYSHPHDALQYGAVELVGDRVMGVDAKGQLVQLQADDEFDPFARYAGQRNRWGHNDGGQQAFAETD